MYQLEFCVIRRPIWEVIYMYVTPVNKSSLLYCPEAFFWKVKSCLYKLLCMLLDLDCTILPFFPKYFAEGHQNKKQLKCRTQIESFDDRVDDC